MEKYDLDFFAQIKLIRQERKVLNDLLEKYLRKQAPKGYPSSTISPEKVQSNSQTHEAVRVYNELAELRAEIEARIVELQDQETQIINKIKRISDSTIRNVLYARYVMELSFKEIQAKYGISKKIFYKKTGTK